MRRLALALPLLLLAACSPDNGGYDTAPPADAPTGVPAEATSPWSGDFNLVGTEPFWGVQIRAGSIDLTRPGQSPLSMPNPGPVSDGDAGVWTTTAFVVLLQVGECSDGMSDRKYPYTATVTTTDQGTLKGCAGPPRDFSEARP